MKIHIDQDYHSRMANLIIEIQRGDTRTYIGMKKGQLVEQQENDFTHAPLPIEPLLSMPQYMMDQFIQAIVEYASSRGINTENENLLKGKILATEKHLEDMREISKSLINKLVHNTEPSR